MDTNTPDIKPNVSELNESVPSPQITLKVRDQLGGEIEFRLKPSTRFSKLAKAYADKKNLRLHDLRFSVDGERIDFISNDKTIQDLQLEDDDVIEVNITQVGGGKS
ncbi:Small ubiquitin- modifier 1 [Coelomomyces lativittatus]|nr:Small ubiquitin- modifier 1 [Coelomomyces lativittatus]KAJ1515219.1 Small ubiquitin- modifier 1 [Coelomomyces lativittatus]KAJ1516687.1 Small ubiquitin- modifier 1 [Coelomomyces lativittatus]